MPRVWTGASMIPILDGRVGVSGPRRGTAHPSISKVARARGPKLCISNCGQTRWPTDHPAFPACDDPATALRFAAQPTVSRLRYTWHFPDAILAIGWSRGVSALVEVLRWTC